MKYAAKDHSCLVKRKDFSESMIRLQATIYQGIEARTESMIVSLSEQRGSL
jgi:hypothetical protein